MKFGDYFQSKTGLVVMLMLADEDDLSYHFRVLNENEFITNGESSLRKDIFKIWYNPMSKEEVIKWKLKHG